MYGTYIYICVPAHEFHLFFPAQFSVIFSNILEKKVERGDQELSPERSPSLSAWNENRTQLE
jgi:hypothetical protein